MGMNMESGDSITLLLKVEGIEEFIGELWLRYATDEEVEEFSEEVYAIHGMNVDRLICDRDGGRYDFVTITKDAPEEVWRIAKGTLKAVSLASI
jgi:hypothetical protein